MLYEKCCWWGFLIPEGLSESQHKKEKTRLQFLTDKTYVKAFQLLTTSDAPFVCLKLNEFLKGWFKPCLPHEDNVNAKQAAADTFQSLTKREFAFLHILPYKNYAQGST